GVTRSVLAGLHRFQLLNGVEIVWALSRLGATALFLAAGHGLMSLGAIQLGASVGGHLTRWLAIRKVAPQIHLTGGPEWRGVSTDVSIFSALSFGYESLRTLFDNADLLLLGILAGPATVAVFSVGVTLASFVSKGLQPISGVLFPMASEMEALGQRSGSARLLEVGTRVNLALALPLVTILLVGGPPDLRVPDPLGRGPDPHRPSLDDSARRLEERVADPLDPDRGTASCLLSCWLRPDLCPGGSVPGRASAGGKSLGGGVPMTGQKVIPRA